MVMMLSALVLAQPLKDCSMSLLVAHQKYLYPNPAFHSLGRQAASYELTDTEVRQLLFDLESAYNDFISTIH